MCSVRYPLYRRLGAETLAPIGIQSPDRPVRRESLYRLQQQPLVPVVSQIKTVHVLSPCFFNTNFNVILPSTPRSIEPSLSYRFPNTPYGFLLSSVRTTCFSHLVLHLITIISDEKHKATRQALCHFSASSKYLPNTLRLRSSLNT